jgi:hypothetical protein
VPGCVSGDEAAERRTADRAEQGRNGQQRHGIEQAFLFDRAHDDEPPDRSHHRSANALEDARKHEIFQRMRQRAADRAEHEYGDGDAKHVARAEPVGGPAAGRDEDGERKQIRGDRELQGERIGADIARDVGERGRDHRRVHVIHEQRNGDDQRCGASVLVRGHLRLSGGSLLALGSGGVEPL